jgi:aminoglycoside phosphotransferase (APT) family kinase protein
VNVVAAYLDEHREALALDGLGLGRDPAFVLITPRFALSAHVVVLILGRDGQPVLAAKLPRRIGDAAQLAHEAANLRAAAAALGDDGTTPGVVAFDEDLGHPLLLQRALRGTPLNGGAVRRMGAPALDAVAGWCDRLAAATAAPADPAARERHVLDPLRLLAERGDVSDAIRDLARRTLPVAGRLAGGDVPQVFEHGDLGHPNLLLDGGGRVGVLDFERAEPAGVAGHDLAFFLTYAAMAIPSHPSAEAVRAAFYGTRPWGMERLLRHLDGLGVSAAWADTILAVCCARVVAAACAGGLVPQVGARDAAGRHLALWSHALNAEAARSLEPARSVA